LNGWCDRLAADTPYEDARLLVRKQWHLHELRSCGDPDRWIWATGYQDPSLRQSVCKFACLLHEVRGSVNVYFICSVDYGIDPKLEDVTKLRCMKSHYRFKAILCVSGVEEHRNWSSGSLLGLAQGDLQCPLSVNRFSCTNIAHEN
jgi:hypothetical protein